jgi:glycosyltransferase involved in cell wall biosynthesis
MLRTKRTRQPKKQQTEQMQDTLTICYVTTRRQCMVEWFLDSLHLQLKPGDENKIKVVVVDFWRDERGSEFLSRSRGVVSHHVGFKPNVWNGPHRLTKTDWFAACNARNTGLCYANSNWIAYCDDLSVLLPGWLDSVKQAMRENYIVFGAYKKTKNTVVENGEVKSFNIHTTDSRLHQASSERTTCAGSWLFGCSLAMPVQALLDVNAWPENLCDGLSFEDCILGMAIGNTGKYTFKYDRRMMTYESEELHHVGPVFRREDWHFENGVAVLGGNGRDDKSHAVLNKASGLSRFDNYFGEGFPDIASLRNHILNGGSFPIRNQPCTDWYSGILLQDL